MPSLSLSTRRRGSESEVRIEIPDAPRRNELVQHPPDPSMSPFIIAARRRSSESDVGVKIPTLSRRDSLLDATSVWSPSSDLVTLMEDYEKLVPAAADGSRDTNHDFLLPMRDVADSSPSPSHPLLAKPSSLFVRPNAQGTPTQSAIRIARAAGGATLPFSQHCPEVSRACVDATLREVNRVSSRASMIHRSVSPASRPPSSPPPVAMSPVERGSPPEKQFRSVQFRSHLRALAEPPTCHLPASAAGFPRAESFELQGGNASRASNAKSVTEDPGEENTAFDVSGRSSLRRRHSEISIKYLPVHQHSRQRQERRKSESTLKVEARPKWRQAVGARIGGGGQVQEVCSSGEPNLALSLTQLYKHMSTRLAQRAGERCRAPQMLHGGVASGGGKDASTVQPSGCLSG